VGKVAVSFRYTENIMKLRLGFTLVEILIVVAVIGVLAAVVFSSLNDAPAQARDAERKADLRSIQIALEQYKKDHGHYPFGCNISSTTDLTVNNAWIGRDDYVSGQIGSGQYECADGSAEYIVGLAPEYIPVLPTDPRLNSDFADSGYVYYTNPDGSVYKIMALNTVETELITSTNETIGNEFARCGDIVTGNQSICQSVPNNSGLSSDSYVYNSGGGSGQFCRAGNIDDWGNDFALYGGFAPRGYRNQFYDQAKAREYFSDMIHCR
jgi:prepilin-type N-terminal cleavage/methylation domain-containing protein